MSYSKFVVILLEKALYFRLKAGSPPNMPEYKTWLHCWKHLKSTNQIKRGSSLLWRYYTGPQVIIGNKAVIVSKDDFMSPSKLQK